MVQFPNLGKSYSHLLPNVRGVILEGYIIFYWVIGEDVEILRVVHGRRNLDTLFEENENY
ncbi:MAG: type II toxin-antitoxin system RelE/ParE family toxin [Cyanobacteria bacterium P01_E01_bin.42]